MKNFIIILLAILFFVSCKKEKLVNDLSGSSYLVRLEADRNEMYNNYVFDSSVWYFRNNTVEIKTVGYAEPDGSGRIYNTSESSYTTIKRKFIVNGNYEYSIKSISNNDFIATLKVINVANLPTATARFYRLN